MRHLLFSEVLEDDNVLILVKDSALDPVNLRTYYVDPLNKLQIPNSKVFAMSVPMGPKMKAAVIAEVITDLHDAICDLGTTKIVVTDSAYFKKLTGKRKVETAYGYAFPCVIKDMEDYSIFYAPLHTTLFYNPANQEKIDLALQAVSDHHLGVKNQFDKNLAEHIYYPQTFEEIRDALKQYLTEPRLSVDIETFSLKHPDSGIGTITFCKDTVHGIAFEVDDHETKKRNGPVRRLLKEFFETYEGKTIYHGSGFDCKILIHQLYRESLTDTAGLIEGLNVLTKNFECTRTISYLALNTCSEISLKLKALAHPFSGDYAKEDINDIQKIPLQELLEYNAIDGLATNYVYDRYWPIVVADNQVDVYTNMMKPTLRLLMAIELSGMPLSISKVQELKQKVTNTVSTSFKFLESTSEVKETMLRIREKQLEAANKKLKTKVKVLGDIPEVEFNPNSPQHLCTLLFDVMEFPILETTATGNPSTEADVVKNLLNYASSDTERGILTNIQEIALADKIISTYIPAFEKAYPIGDGVALLFGNFNIGPISGRLSSSDPNLQNLPSKGAYGKLIKECFVSTYEWLFGGADFHSLEDYISALTTKDPNKLAVYIQGYDGHCLRAQSYFPEQMPDIIPGNVESINSIKKKYEHLRDESKAPTFALTYQGTYLTLMRNLGWAKEKAQTVESAFQSLYKVSIDWVTEKIKQASTDGYVTLAFGLRLRTPVLSQSLFNRPQAVKQALAESRSAGNALGQSYCMLNNRAAIAFMEKVWKSEYALDIMAVALIHDAIYIRWRNCPKVTKWVNDNLIEEMRWQELPEIQHDTVKLGAELDIFYPNWSKGLTLKNDLTEDEIIERANEHAESLKKKI